MAIETDDFARAPRQRPERKLDALAHRHIGRQRLERGGGLLLVVAERDQRLLDVAMRVAQQQPAARQGPKVGTELALEFEQQALGGLLADARHLDQAAGLLRGHGLRQLGHAHARQQAQRHARTDAADLDQLPKGLTFSGSRKAIQQLRVLADDKMRQQRDFLAQVRQAVEGAHRHIDLVAHATAVDQDLGRGFFQQRSAQFAYH